MENLAEHEEKRLYEIIYSLGSCLQSNWVWVYVYIVVCRSLFASWFVQYRYLCNKFTQFYFIFAPLIIICCNNFSMDLESNFPNETARASESNIRKNIDNVGFLSMIQYIWMFLYFLRESERYSKTTERANETLKNRSVHWMFFGRTVCMR